MIVAKTIKEKDIHACLKTNMGEILVSKKLISQKRSLSFLNAPPRNLFLNTPLFLYLLKSVPSKLTPILSLLFPNEKNALKKGAPEADSLYLISG